jgi:hypothetical protein
MKTLHATIGILGALLLASTAMAQRPVPRERPDDLRERVLDLRRRADEVRERAAELRERIREKADQDRDGRFDEEFKDRMRERMEGRHGHGRAAPQRMRRPLLRAQMLRRMHEHRMGMDRRPMQRGEERHEAGPRRARPNPPMRDRIEDLEPDRRPAPPRFRGEPPRGTERRRV